KGISGPDTTGVSFDYEPFTNRIDARTDRRQVTTSYAYQAGKLWQSVVDTAGLRITTELRALETVGLSPNAVTVDSAYALLDGPRPDSDVLDHTRFWLDRFGAPWKIRDALGNETVLQRGSATYPALVTRVEYPRL